MERILGVGLQGLRWVLPWGEQGPAGEAVSWRSLVQRYLEGMGSGRSHAAQGIGHSAPRARCRRPHRVACPHRAVEWLCRYR